MKENMENFFSRNSNLTNFKMELFSLNPNISAKPLSNNQGWFRNPQDELISKLSLIVRFDQELAEIFGVKEKASISKSTRFFVVRCIWLSYVKQRCYI